MIRADFEGCGERREGHPGPDVSPERHPCAAHHQRRVDQGPHLRDVACGDDQQEVGGESVCESGDDADPGVYLPDEEHDPECEHGEKEECGGGVDPSCDLPDGVFHEHRGVLDVDQIGGHSTEHSSGPLRVFAGLVSHVVDVAGHSAVLDDVVLWEHLAAELRCEVGCRGDEEEEDRNGSGDYFRKFSFEKNHFTESLPRPKVRKKRDSPCLEREK